MTLATRCPACGTAFKVVGDQLRVSSGWVRCGRCQASFDALDHLFRREPPPVAASAPDPEPAAEAAEEAAEEAAHAAAPEAARQLAPEAVPEPALEPVMDPALPPAAEEHEALVEPPAEPPEQDALHQTSAPGFQTEPEPERQPEPEPEDLPVPESAAPVTPEEPSPAAADAPEPHPQAAPLSAAAATATPDAQADLPKAPIDLPRDPGFRQMARPRFVRRAEAAARWRHPATRLALGAFACVLAALLAAQASLLWRDSIALHWPAVRPVLEAACVPLKCRLDAPRRIEQLSVESSDLRQLAPGSPVYRLDLTLRNRGDLDVLPPAFDLRLTDASERLLARRVLTLAELGHPARVVAAGSELVVQADLEAGTGAVSGYTIAIFYP